MPKQATHGRPRSFDANEALRSAMSAFWSAGYAATSYDDLEKATKLRRQSLIYAFGSKRDLFKKALALYSRERVDEIVALLAREGSPLANIEQVFASWLSDVDAGARNGCLLVNASGELGRSDPEIADAISQATNRLRRSFARAFERAREAGELSPEHNPRDLACLAVACGDGALLHARTSGEAAHAMRAFAAFIKLLR